MSETALPSSRDRRRGEILEAAFHEFAAKGYAGASMLAIAQRARASKETLYAWFENKETLFSTLFATRLAAMASNVDHVATASGDEPTPEKVLPIIAADVIRFTAAMAPLTQAMGAGEPGERALRLVGRTIAAERGRFADYLLRLRAAGHIAFDDDPMELVSLFVSMAEGEWAQRLAIGMIDRLTDELIEDHAQRVTRVFLSGLAPR